MSRTNLFTLIATVLLGILLYTLLQFTAELQQAPPEEAAPAAAAARPDNQRPARPATATPTVTGLPHISSYEELVAFLDEGGINGRLLVDEAARWYARHGFLGPNALLGVTPAGAPRTYYESLDTATLRAMSDAGDAGATQTLARLAMFEDPFAAMRLYEKAVSQGSVYAAIKVADTLSLFAGSQLVDYLTDRELLKRLFDLQRSVPGRNLHTEAYAMILSALREGGSPIIDADLLGWAAVLEENTPQRTLEYACRRSSEILVASGAARRNNGVAPLATQPPPVFLALPDLEHLMPCSATRFPLFSMMDLSRCSTTRVIGRSGDEADLHVCPR
ncbi:MAG: hypothetical protein ACE5G3_10745 [Gammaproteobacteria bacterium]